MGITGNSIYNSASVDTPQDLAGLPDDAYKNGDFAFVRSLMPNGTFRLNRNGGGPADNAQIVATHSGNGFWEVFNQSGVVSVATIADLGAYPDGGLQEGAIAWVASLRSPFFLGDTVPLVAADNITSVDAVSGRRWFRAMESNRSWVEQYTSWEIDPTNGDDENTGTTGDPLRTFAELRRRLYGQNIPATITITLLGNLPANDPIVLTEFQCGPGADISVVGTRTASAGGTIAAATALDRAAGAPTPLTQITSADVVGGWAANLKRQIRITTPGARLDARAWVVADLGAGVAEVTPFMLIATPQSSPAYVNGNGAPTPGDTFEFVDLSEVGERATVDLGSGGANVARVAFTDLSFPAAIATLAVGVRSTLVRYNNCQVLSAVALGTSNVYLQNCRTGRASVSEAGILTCRAGIVDTALSTGIVGTFNGGWLLLDQDVVLTGAVTCNTSFARGDGTVTISNTALKLAAGSGGRVFDFGVHSVVTLNGIVYGTTNVVGMRLHANARVTYTAPVVPTANTGAGANIDYGGGVTQTWAAMAAAVNTSQPNGASFYLEQ